MEEQEIQIRVEQELQKILSNPDNVIAAYQKSLEAKILQIEEMKPKVEMWNMAMGSDRLEEMASVVKILNFKNMGRNKLFDYLRDRNILRENNEPYQRYVDAGYFKLIEQIIKSGSYTIINNKTMVTQKGIDYIGKLLKEDNYESNPR